MACRVAARRLLGVADNATAQEIRGAFRRKALQCHPDRNRAPNAATEFLEARAALDLLLAPAPAADATAATYSAAYDARPSERAVVFREVRSLDEELAAALSRAVAGPELVVDPVTLRVRGADDFPGAFEMDERNADAGGLPVLRLRHGDATIGSADASDDDAVVVALFGRVVAEATRDASALRVRRGGREVAVAARDGESWATECGFACATARTPGVETTTWRRVRRGYRTECRVTRAYSPPLALWRPFFFWGDADLYADYASDGSSASHYVERRVADERALDDASRGRLDPALVVAAAAFSALDRERRRLS